MRVFLTGGTGLIGRGLVRRLLDRGDQAVVVTRDAEAARRKAPAAGLTFVPGDPTFHGRWQQEIDGSDAVINLVGHNVFADRWNAVVKRKIRDSRVQSTERVVDAIGQAARRPKVLVQASAVGYYGPHGDEDLTEASPAGDDFMAEVCREWEAASAPAEALGLRLALLRTGVVLAKNEGALRAMTPVYRWVPGGAAPVGNGGRLFKPADGRQWLSWIHLDDIVGLFLLALDDPDASGAINGTGPRPARHVDFGKALAHVLHRPFLPFGPPDALLQLLLGEVAQVVARGQKVLPARAEALGFAFKFPDLGGALADVFSRHDQPPRAVPLSAPEGPSPLMVLGTASHVGKSVLTAAFCRLIAEAGGKVAPFKAQNMALNSFVTREGAEIGRAQAAQAEAAGVEPLAEMNPVLLKPMGGVSQVVLEGAPIGVMSAREYYAAKASIWPRVTSCYDRLAGAFDFVVLEGAGSPVEINLIEHDLTNFKMARHADAAVVLVADIERGGVFAQIVGTWELMTAADRASVAGFIINKFRGDVSLLDGGLEFVRERTGVPVLGVLPFVPDLLVDQEDSLGLPDTATPAGPSATGPGIDVAVIRLPHVSNFTDLMPLARAPGVRLRYVERAADLGPSDLVILPGTKATVADLEWLRRVGLAGALLEAAGRDDGPTLLGLCGGFQMLGTAIHDPLGVESDNPSAPGLGLIGMDTTFAPGKHRHRASGRSEPEGWPVMGYEIHMGETVLAPGVRPWLWLARENTGREAPDGAVGSSGRVLGTYLHGLFDNLDFTANFVNRLRARKGLAPLAGPAWESHRQALADRYGPLAALLRDRLDLGPIGKALGIDLVRRRA